MIKNLSELKDAIGFTVLAAPDRFPKLGAFGEDQRKNLDTAFERLRSGLVFLPKRLKESPLMQEVEKLLEESHSAYAAGDKTRGSHLLQDLDDIVHPGRFVEYEARKGEGAA
jgi:hypothetical protein